MRCPHCHEESFAKKKLLRDGWTITGEIEVCALCGRELNSKSTPETGVPAADKNLERRWKLADLLGGEEPTQVKLAGDADRRFCRNCRHFIIHPFRNYCALSDRDTDPMGECDRFSGRD